MLKLITIFVLFCLYRDVVLSGDTNSELPEKIFYQLDDTDKLFKEFMVKYNKNYNSAEIEHRRKVFHDNLIKINQWNHERPESVFGIGPFTDLTFEEFTETHTGFLGNFTNENDIKYEPNGMAPESLDWRQNNIITRVKNQQRCGSCYVFSAMGNIEALYAKQHGQLIELSEQQGLDCNPRDCQGGYPHEVMQTLAQQGCMKESEYPYEAAKRQCRTDSNKVAVRVTGGQTISVGSEEGLKDAVARYGPLSVSFAVEPAMPYHTGGVYIPRDCESAQNYHAVLLVGYGTDNGTPYWLMKNSWGADWCESGYFRMVRGRKACNIGYYVATATVA